MLNCFCNVLISIIIIIVKLKKFTQIKIDTKHRNLVRIWSEYGQNEVGIWSEYGQNMVGMRSEYGQNMVRNDLKIHLFSTRIPLGMTQKNLEWLKIWVWIFFIFSLGMRSEFGQIPTIPLRSAWNVWGRVKYCFNHVNGPFVPYHYWLVNWGSINRLIW